MTEIRASAPPARGQIIAFAPRRSRLNHSGATDTSTPPGMDPSLARFERIPGTDDDFRHRMRTNSAACLITALLTGIGIWLALTMADQQKSQDCLLMGRRDCAQLVVR